MADQRSEREEILSKLADAVYKNEIVEKIDISEKDYTFSDFSEVMADRMTATGARLRATVFIRASFRDCDFDSADLRSCNFEHVDIADCFFRDANFYKSTMRFASINISFCDRACFDEVDLTNGNLLDTAFNGSTFRNANLSGVNAKDANFKDVDFTGANLANGNFEGANFINAKLDNVKWAGANIIGARFDEGVLELIQKEL